MLVVFVFRKFWGGREDGRGSDHRKEGQRYQKVMHEKPFLHLQHAHGPDLIR